MCLCSKKKIFSTQLTIICSHVYVYIFLSYMYVDARQLPKVSLSPQRKSFHGGCSWNDGKVPDTPSSAKDNTGHFELENTYPLTSKANQGSSQQGPLLQPKHKVIDHVPLRDQELGRGSKKNWREKSKDSEWAKKNVNTCLFSGLELLFKCR